MTDNTIHSDTIRELRALLEKATPGPWKTFDSGLGVRQTGGPFVVGAQQWADAALIVAAINALPSLLDALPRDPTTIPEIVDEITDRYGDALTALALPREPGLSEAWAACEAALPEGWIVGELKNTAYRGAGERWLVMAWEFTDDPDYRTFKHGYGDTPTAALQALTATLSEHGEPG